MTFFNFIILYRVEFFSFLIIILWFEKRWSFYYIVAILPKWQLKVIGSLTPFKKSILAAKNCVSLFALLNTKSVSFYFSEKVARNCQNFHFLQLEVKKIFKKISISRYKSLKKRVSFIFLDQRLRCANFFLTITSWTNQRPKSSAEIHSQSFIKIKIKTRKDSSR